jgi:hypothetical protein
MSLRLWICADSWPWYGFEESCIRCVEEIAGRIVRMDLGISESGLWTLEGNELGNGLERSRKGQVCVRIRKNLRNDANEGRCEREGHPSKSGTNGPMTWRVKPEQSQEI